MQQKFRESLHARTSGIIEQINAKPEKASKNPTTSTPQSNIHPDQGNTVNNRVHSIGARRDENTTQNFNQAVRHQREDGERNDRSYIDWLIAVIVIAILAILYRRIAAHLNFSPGPVSSNEGSHSDPSDSGLLHNVDEM